MFIDKHVWKLKQVDRHLNEFEVFVRNRFQQMLFHKEAESIVRKIVENILDDVRTPERARSPIGFYMTEQEQFQEKNPDVRMIQRLK